MILYPSERELIWLEVNQFRLEFDNKRCISGDYLLDRTFAGNRYQDRFALRIDLMVKTISDVPTVYIEPNCFHEKFDGHADLWGTYHVNRDYSMCLCLPELAGRFLPDGFNLIDFCRNLVDPFLVWITHLRDHGEKLWGECGHGIQGYIDAHQEGLISTQTLAGQCDYAYRHGRGT